jgi:hypothetical protein
VDGVFSGDVNYDSQWNGIWEGAAHVDGAGWTAEFYIPFSQLAFAHPDTASTCPKSGRIVAAAVNDVPSPAVTSTPPVTVDAVDPGVVAYPSQINLTTFELFQTERRPFFVGRQRVRICVGVELRRAGQLVCRGDAVLFQASRARRGPDPRSAEGGRADGQRLDDWRVQRRE